MMRVAKTLASLRLTLVGMLLLAVLAVVGSRDPEIGTGITVWPIALLVVNLLAALLTNKSFRTQTGLLVFHLGLLLVFACVGLTVLMGYEGRVEIVQGGAFDAGQVTTMQQGWWHEPRLDGVDLEQGEVRVNYLPNFIRLDTSSSIRYRTETGQLRDVTIGDQRTANINGYEFAATFNKGFAVLLRWIGDDGSVALGSVHFPSYPSFDWKQVMTWTTPAGQALELELDFETPVADPVAAWTLGDTNVPFSLRVSPAGGVMGDLRNGDAMATVGGAIRVEGLRMWMAYRISYLPFLTWMFVSAMLAIAGLAIHFGSRYLPHAKPVEKNRQEGVGARVARV